MIHKSMTGGIEDDYTRIILKHGIIKGGPACNCAGMPLSDFVLESRKVS